MNHENVLLVAERLEEINAGGRSDLFNMADWGEKFLEDINLPSTWNRLLDCNSPACIAGWTVEALADNDTIDSICWGNDDGIDVTAKSLLGLNADQAYALFSPGTATPGYNSCGYDNITIEQAIATLRHLAATGEVVWQIEDATNGQH